MAHVTESMNSLFNIYSLLSLRNENPVLEVQSCDQLKDNNSQSPLQIGSHVTKVLANEMEADSRTYGHLSTSHCLHVKHAELRNTMFALYHIQSRKSPFLSLRKTSPGYGRNGVQQAPWSQTIWVWISAPHFVALWLWENYLTSLCLTFSVNVGNNFTDLTYVSRGSNELKSLKF